MVPTSEKGVVRLSAGNWITIIGIIVGQATLIMVAMWSFSVDVREQMASLKTAQAFKFQEYDRALDRLDRRIPLSSSPTQRAPR